MSERYRPSSLGIGNRQTSAASSATALTASNRARFYIQNVGTNPLFVKLGASASTTDYDFILKADTSAAAGAGGAITVDGYTGVVSVAGTSPAYCCHELT